MQTLQTPHLFTFLPPKTLPKPYTKPHNPPPKTNHLPCKTLAVKSSLSSDEFPVDETFLESFGPKEKESEDEARRRNWVERGWAPWEEILSPEALFARHSLNEGEEVPLQTPEAIEAFKMLSPKYRKKKMEEMGLTEDDYYAKQFEIKGDIPEPLDTTWAGPLVVRHVPPRDWPPRGWEVDRGELEFIREAHRLMAVRVDLEEVEKEAKTDTEGLCLDRYKVFLKQYNEWVAANKDRLEEESYKYDQDYYPGRRKRGKDYKEGMYELPFYYPGQICAGKVTTLHLYQGAFVDIGGVYDGWVPIKRNDWYWIRHHIKVGMHVIVEILAKRDPYRFRFPIEMRFVDPNIDHLIFNRFDFPPIFHRDEDTNPDEIRRDCRRPPIPIKDPGIKVEEEPLLSNHPYVDKNSSNHANMKTFSSGMPSLQKPIASSHRRLGRSLSQKDLSKLHDDYSGQSSVLTDDEANDARSSKNMIEKTIRAVYAQKKAEHPTGDDVNSGLFEAMRKELRYAVDEIKMELEHGMVRKTSALASESSLWADDSNVLQAVPKVRKKYTTKLEQSEKRKQDLLAEIALEEQHGRELSKIVRELLPDPKSSANAEKPSRARKRSNDKNRVSKRLTEEAEKYFEDFISNVEDTDLSSYDGERSDASSTLRVTKTRDAVLHSGERDTFRTQTRSNYPPVEIMDGVILPWLQWETCNDGSALPSKNKRELPMTPQSISWDADQEVISAQHPSGNSASSRGSWSPGLDGPSSTGEGSILKEVASHQRSQFDMDRYLKLRREEDHLFERWKEQNRINSGGLLLCSSNAFF